MASSSALRSSDFQFESRGGETTRLETFIDAAFAFALTLLVISFDAVPTNFTDLTNALKAVPAFLFGFALLIMFWFGHRNWSIRYGLDTTAAALLSLTLIFVLLVYVYPLRAMATAATSAMTNGWLPNEFTISTSSEARGLFVIYGIGYAVANACLVGLNLHAYKLREHIGLTAQEAYFTRVEIISWVIVGSLGLVSAILAVMLPLQMLSMAGWIYASLAIIMPIFGRTVEKRFDRRFGASTGGQ
ncbi:MAG: TMEM175 family protein [Pseudomonadota bacterium]